MKVEKLLLACGVAFPAIYFINLFGVGALTPGFQQGSQAPSDLGAAGAPHAALFNLGLGLSALAAFLGAIGLVIGLKRAGAGLYVSAMTGLSLALLAFALGMSAAFPLPNPLHYGFNLYFAGLLTPLFGVLALGGVRGAGAARALVLLGLIASFALVLIGLGFLGIADETNAGWWIRALALANFGTIAFLSWTVMRSRPA